jgi:hypothetical protein
MKLPDDFATTLQRLRAQVHDIRARLTNDPQTRALSTFLRPHLGPTPAPLRGLLEPVVAAAAVSLLATLLMVGAFSFATLLAVLGLVYAILTYVFGVQLSLAT